MSPSDREVAAYITSSKKLLFSSCFAITQRLPTTCLIVVNVIFIVSLSSIPSTQALVVSKAFIVSSVIDDHRFFTAIKGNQVHGTRTSIAESGNNDSLDQLSRADASQYKQSLCEAFPLRSEQIEQKAAAAREPS